VPTLQLHVQGVIAPHVSSTGGAPAATTRSFFCRIPPSFFTLTTRSLFLCDTARQSLNDPYSRIFSYLPSRVRDDSISYHFPGLANSALCVVTRSCSLTLLVTATFSRSRDPYELISEHLPGPRQHFKSIAYLIDSESRPNFHVKLTIETPAPYRVLSDGFHLQHEFGGEQ
jgi:hypothetical protein